MGTPCLEHERLIGEMESQLNGKGGIADRIGQMEQKVDSLHTKLTFGIGFLAALQILVPIVAPHVANAFFSINNPILMPKWSFSIDSLRWCLSSTTSKTEAKYLAAVT